MTSDATRLTLTTCRAKVREGEFLVHCILTGRDIPTQVLHPEHLHIPTLSPSLVTLVQFVQHAHLQKFVGEGNLPYEAKREAAIKAKDFLTQGGQGNGLAKKVTGEAVIFAILLTSSTSSCHHPRVIIIVSSSS